MKLKQPPAPQRPRQTTLEGKRSGFMLIALPLPQDNAAPCGEGLSWASGSPSGERNQGGTTSFPQLCGSLCRNFYFDFTPWGLQGNPQGPATGNRLWQRKRERFATTSTWVLASAQVVIPTQQICSSAEPSQGYTLNRKLGRRTHLPD